MTTSQGSVAIDRVLYGLDQPQVVTDAQGHDHFGAPEFKSIVKDNRTEIDLGIFTNDSYKEISAVIFSTTGTFGKALVEAKTATFVESVWYSAKRDKLERRFVKAEDHHEHLFDGLHVYHNPYAEYPLDRSVFEHSSICQHFYNPNLGILSDNKDHLLFRNPMTFLLEPDEPMRKDATQTVTDAS